MGLFGAYLYDSRGWTETQADVPPVAAEPWLLLDMHDGGLATVMYRPAGEASGTAYLGRTPRRYFEDAGASAPTDVALEATGLAEWWERFRGEVQPAERRAKERELVLHLAEDVEPDEAPLERGADDEHVEVLAARFIAALDLPVPAQLVAAGG